MSRISQTPIPPVTPEEPLTPALFNQIIQGANNARQITGAGGVNVTNISGMIGISGPTLPQGNLSVLVLVDASTSYGPGLYGGSFYAQPIYQPTADASGNSLTTLAQIAPVPAQQTCVILDTNSLGVSTTPNPASLTAIAKPINGILVGTAGNGMPLVAIQYPRGPWPAKITAVSGSTPGPWNYTAQTYDGLTTFKVVFNALEGGNGSSASLLVGTPGSLGVNVGSNGTVNGMACVVQSIGVGAGVLIMPNPVTSGQPGYFGGFLFYGATNSAQ